MGGVYTKVGGSSEDSSYASIDAGNQLVELANGKKVLATVSVGVNLNPNAGDGKRYEVEFSFGDKTIKRETNLHNLSPDTLRRIQSEAPQLGISDKLRDRLIEDVHSAMGQDLDQKFEVGGVKVFLFTETKKVGERPILADAVFCMRETNKSGASMERVYNLGQLQKAAEQGNLSFGQKRDLDQIKKALANLSGDSVAMFKYELSQILGPQKVKI